MVNGNRGGLFMKKAFVYSLLAALAITGCQAELEEITQESSKVFTAIIDGDFGKDTKTFLDGSGNVLWKQYDQVSIFAGSTINEQYQVSDDSDGKTSATLNKVSGGSFVAGSEIDNNVAFYPYASTAELTKSGDNYVISGIELPAAQTYAAGSFGNGAFPMAAVTNTTEDMNLKFKNVLGGLKLQLKGAATITSITVTGNNNEILCGDGEVASTYGEVPSITLSDASAKTVILDCGAGVTLDAETATPFIIALPPMTMTGGFTVVVTDSESKQMEIKTTKPQTILRSNLLKMPAVNYVGEVKPFSITSNGTTSVSINKSGTPDDIVLEYRKGAGEWASYTIGNSIDLADGETLQYRAGVDGNETFSKSVSAYYNVSVTGSGTITVSGNIMSLLDRNQERVSVSQNAFYKFFYGCAKLSSASELSLPATTLATSCYGSMFYNCTGLTSAPVLPATTLATSCYDSMFANCRGMTSAPALPATSLAYGCYSNMFSLCSGLTSAPALPATSLASSCYGSMFYQCTGLTSAPELPATTLATSCYARMFYNCTGLTSAPELPATSLANDCYYEMFYYCTKLTSAPELPATSLANECYAGMFNQCVKLTSAPELPATTLANSCYSNMFYGCTGLTTAPELPATTLRQSCYYRMFYGCTGLTTAPELPAETLAIQCYSGMFVNCSSLNFIKMLATNISASNCLSNWVAGVAATGTFVKNSSATWDVTGVNGVPSGWTIETE